MVYQTEETWQTGNIVNTHTAFIVPTEINVHLILSLYYLRELLYFQCHTNKPLLLFTETSPLVAKEEKLLAER